MKHRTIGLAIAAGLGLLATSGAASAAVCDFTTETFGSGTGQSGTAGLSIDNATCSVTGSTGTALFQIPTGKYSVGTGVIEPFLTIQANGTEAGFNTDKSPAPLDAKRTGGGGDVGFTNSLLLGAVPIKIIDGVAYREILLDLNQTSANPWLSLDVIRIFGGSTGNLADTYSITPDGFDTTGMVRQGGTDLNLLWSLDFGDTNQALLLDYRLCDDAVLGTCPKGSGNTYDLRYLLPNSLFATLTDSSYFVMYTSFGWQPGDNNGPKKNNGQATSRSFTSNDGFEEWAILKNTTDCPVGSTDPACNPYDTPEPGTLALLGLGLLGLSLSRKRMMLN